MSTRSIYLHSSRSDFAETQRMPEAAYLGRLLDLGQLKVLGCGCGAAKLVRIGRSPWMRLLPYFRLYRCFSCGCRVLRARTRQRIFYGAARMLPAAPLSAPLAQSRRAYVRHSALAAGYGFAAHR
jgi:hypothetical protein